MLDPSNWIKGRRRGFGREEHGRLTLLVAAEERGCC